MKPVVVLVALLCLGPAVPGLGARTDGPSPSAERMLGRVRSLTTPTLAGRGSGTTGLLAAADSVAAWLAAAGLEPAFAGGWFQDVPLSGEGWAGQDLAGRHDRNVGGTLPGHGALADRFLVIGAHYDHLGRVAPAPDDAPPPAADGYYPGANDNASGVAVVTEIVAALRAAGADTTARRSLLFVFFGGEEVGLQGSARFVAAPPVPLDRIDAMINFDTVGQLTDDRLYVSGIGTSPVLPELVTAANRDGLALTLGQGGWSGSDHMSFNTREVPVVFVFGGPYPQYNRPADTWETLDAAGLVKVAAYGARLAASLAATPDTLPWVMVAGRQLREDDGEQDRDTWFGSLPDFTEEVRGYLLAGVFAESPAARAGLRKGDLLTRLAGEEVVDLATFTRALRSHAPGDLVEVEIERDGRVLRFTVVLGNRADRK